jgi:hypothetical protein
MTLPPARRWDKPMFRSTDEAYWRDLESNAHLPEVQDIIRQEIQNGTIRVRPKPGGGIRIMPVGIPDNGEVREVESPPTPREDETSPVRRAVRRHHATHR